MNVNQIRSEIYINMLRKLLGQPLELTRNKEGTAVREQIGRGLQVDRVTSALLGGLDGAETNYSWGRAWGLDAKGDKIFPNYPIAAAWQSAVTGAGERRVQQATEGDIGSGRTATTEEEREVFIAGFRLFKWATITAIAYLLFQAIATALP